jgi:hypothetical protein
MSDARQAAKRVIPRIWPKVDERLIDAFFDSVYPRGHKNHKPWAQIAAEYFPEKKASTVMADIHHFGYKFSSLILAGHQHQERVERVKAEKEAKATQERQHRQPKAVVAHARARKEYTRELRSILGLGTRGRLDPMKSAEYTAKLSEWDSSHPVPEVEGKLEEAPVETPTVVEA